MGQADFCWDLQQWQTWCKRRKQKLAGKIRENIFTTWRRNSSQRPLLNMLLAFIHHVTSLPVSFMCMWQCNWTASGTSEPTLQCSPFPPVSAAGREERQTAKPCASPCAAGQAGVRVAAPGQQLALDVEKGLFLWHWCLPLGTLPAWTPAWVIAKCSCHFSSTSLEYLLLSTFGKKTGGKKIHIR